MRVLDGFLLFLCLVSQGGSELQQTTEVASEWTALSPQGRTPCRSRFLQLQVEPMRTQAFWISSLTREHVFRTYELLPVPARASQPLPATQAMLMVGFIHSDSKHPSPATRWVCTVTAKRAMPAVARPVSGSSVSGEGPGGGKGALRCGGRGSAALLQLG